MTRRLGAFVWLALACGAAAQTPVILISIDTLRADHLSAYGYHAIATPNIDAFAQHGTLFTDVNSQIPLTLPSHTSLLTSTYPFQSGVEENGEIVPSGAVTLASVLQAQGYKTAAFIGSDILARSAGLDKGFETYDSPFGAPAAEAESPYSSRVRRDGALVLRAATQWLAGHQGQPAFVFIHLFDLHAPYRLQPTRGSALPALAGYDAQLRYVDQLLGRFSQTLMKDGWWQRSIVVLLADHGESLGEHGESSHGFFTYESTLHVPLIVHWPASEHEYPARSTHPAGLIDVAPTLLDALHLPAPASFAGTSLMKFDESPLHPVFSEATYTSDQFGWAPLHALRLGEWKFVEAPHGELYDLGKDPGERSNVLRANSVKTNTLHVELANLMARYAGAGAAKTDTSAGTRRTLQSLGYLGGSPARGDAGSGADPKDKIAEYQLFEKALDEFYAHQVDAAIANLERLLAKDPGNQPAKRALDRINHKHPPG
ncbi:MAG TPA: sulfatase [Bryobacteraceae bacterium]|nr:sulfatase [Bryobacteraceae bacterium]